MLQFGRETKEERKERIEREAVKLVKGSFERNIDLIRADWDKSSGHEKEKLLSAFEGAFQRAIKKQDDGLLGNAAYVCLFYLRSSALLGTGDFLIEVFDDEFYRNKIDGEEIWTPDLVMKYWRQDIELLEKKLPSSIMGLKKYELAGIKVNLAGDYYKVALEFLLESMDDILALPSFIEMNKVENLKFLYSGIYEPYLILHEIGEEQDDNIKKGAEEL